MHDSTPLPDDDWSPVSKNLSLPRLLLAIVVGAILAGIIGLTRMVCGKDIE